MSQQFSQSLQESLTTSKRTRIDSTRTKPSIKMANRISFLSLKPQNWMPQLNYCLTSNRAAPRVMNIWHLLRTYKPMIRRVKSQANLGVWSKRMRRGRMRIILTRLPTLLKKDSKLRGPWSHSECRASKVKWIMILLHMEIPWRDLMMRAIP